VVLYTVISNNFENSVLSEVFAVGNPQFWL